MATISPQWLWSIHYSQIYYNEITRPQRLHCTALSVFQVLFTLLQQFSAGVHHNFKPQLRVAYGEVFYAIDTIESFVLLYSRKLWWGFQFGELANLWKIAKFKSCQYLIFWWLARTRIAHGTRINNVWKPFCHGDDVATQVNQGWKAHASFFYLCVPIHSSAKGSRQC